MVMTMPTAAMPLGRSPNMMKPTTVANGISRYWIGASVEAGARRRSPGHQEMCERADDAERGEHCGLSGFRHLDLEARPAGRPTEHECCDEHRCRHQSAHRLQRQRVSLLCDPAADQHVEGEDDRHDEGKQRRRANLGEARLDHEKRAGEADDARGEPAPADLLVEQVACEQQQDERHDESDGDGIGQRQVAERGEHRSYTGELQRGPQRCEPKNARR